MKEKCYFCDRESEYDQVVEIDDSAYIVDGLCKLHLRMNLSL